MVIGEDGKVVAQDFWRKIIMQKGKTIIVIVFVCEGCQDKISETGWLTQQEFMFSQEVRDQGVGRFGFSESSLSPSLADGHLLAGFSHGLFLHVCASWCLLFF